LADGIDEVDIDDPRFGYVDVVYGNTRVSTSPTLFVSESDTS